MSTEWKILITVMLVGLGIGLIFYVANTLKKQNDIVKIGRTLAKRGRFNIVSYIKNEDCLKDVSWLKHSNKGVFLDTPIKLQNYTKDCSIFIERDDKNE